MPHFTSSINKTRKVHLRKLSDKMVCHEYRLETFKRKISLSNCRNDNLNLMQLIDQEIYDSK